MATMWTGIVLVLLVWFCSGTIPHWDYFTFTQQWPPTVCIEGKLMNRTRTCKIPSYVNYWTIHGLWPSGNNHHDPWCPGTPPFDLNLIKDLLPQLNRFWPDVYEVHGNKSYEFWREEWKKHGTCASSLRATGNERLYFKKTLELREKYDLTQILKKCGIVPSTRKTYRRNDFVDCYQKAFGSKVALRCVRDETGHRVDIIETRLCMSKEFKPFDCRRSSGEPEHSVQKIKKTQPCPSGGIHYIPTKHY